MEHEIPVVLTIPNVEIDSLEELSGVLLQDVKVKMSQYGKLFSRLLIKHLTTETEVKIVNGLVTADSGVVLDRLGCEKHLLCYRKHILDIYRPWYLIMCGQPILPGVENQISDVISTAIQSFETFMYSIQKMSVSLEYKTNNTMCKRLCTTTHSVVNFTATEVSTELQQLLSSGINFVPTVVRSNFDLLDIIENDLKIAAIKVFREKAMYYPRLNADLGLKNVILQLIQQTPSNTSEINFYLELYESYIGRVSTFLNELNFSHLENYENIKQLVPKNTVLTISDKGLGPCLLPVEWYIEQYKHQAELGGHRATNMSEQQCLNSMLNSIQLFRNSLLNEERIIFGKYYKKCKPYHRVGCLKIIPKIHKLKGAITADSWKLLPSRPIRGGENCPVNSYSIALCGMLQELHKTVKQLYLNGNMGGCTFPIIHGSDEYMYCLIQYTLCCVNNMAGKN